jgi:hypothetical protein
MTNEINGSNLPNLTTPANVVAECEAWLTRRDRALTARDHARHGPDAVHFTLRRSVFDPEALTEPLRTMAMRALGYPDYLIAGTATRRTFTDFARKHTTREGLGGSPRDFYAEF